MTHNTKATSVAVMSFIFYRKLRELIDLCIQIQLKSVSSNNSSQYDDTIQYAHAPYPK